VAQRAEADRQTEKLEELERRLSRSLSGSLLLVLADVAQERAAKDLTKQRRRARVLSRQSALLVLSGLAVISYSGVFL